MIIHIVMFAKIHRSICKVSTRKRGNIYAVTGNFKG